VLVDLTAAYDFTCYRGLTCKLLRLLPGRHIFCMIMDLVSIRSFTLTTGLGCWDNNVAITHAEHSPGPLNSRVVLVHSTAE